MKTILLLVLAITCISEGLDFDDCGSTATLHSVVLSGCEQQPCTLRSGGTYYFEAVIGTYDSSNTIPFTVTANILGIEFTFISGDACDILTVGSCPVYEGKVFTARDYMTLPGTLPPISTRMRGIMRDDNDRVLLCAEIAIQIVN